VLGPDRSGFVGYFLPGLGVVSEYQSREFLSVDRPLTAAEMAERRVVS